jgi:4'-phosphopantetheinyl transferase
VRCGEDPAPVHISLSHRSGIAVCAVAAAPNRLGCDLELIEPHSAAFLADYFTPEEQAWVKGSSYDDWPQRLTLLWSAKESVLKALGLGLRLDTRSVCIRPTVLERSQDWAPLSAWAGQDEVFDGWWRRAGGFVQTVATLAVPGAGGSASNNSIVLLELTGSRA